MSNESSSTTLDKAERVNSIFSVYGCFFSCGFHTLLWKVIFSEVTKGREVTFYPVHAGHGMMMVLADKTGGYIQTPATFRPSENFETALSICIMLSKEIFNQSEHEHQIIADQSFINNFKG